jgi:hypothetical protein
MNYGKVISGGARMTKGVTKGINNKLEEFAEGHKRAQKIATAVGDAYKVDTLSTQHTNDVRQFGKFKKPFVPKNV